MATAIVICPQSMPKVVNLITVATAFRSPPAAVNRRRPPHDQLRRGSKIHSRLPPATFRPRRRWNCLIKGISSIFSAGHCVVDSGAGELRRLNQMVVRETSTLEGSFPTRLQPNRRPGLPDFFTHRRRHYSHPKLQLFQFRFFFPEVLLI